MRQGIGAGVFRLAALKDSGGIDGEVGKVLENMDVLIVVLHAALHLWMQGGIFWDFVWFWGGRGKSPLSLRKGGYSKP
ncbi:hypothetical protein [Geomonas agri]|uniref:hypothetical protein n=1 Tax=Geomonas agri TaxID=2873702 RepID=UPI001CD801EF|nr:hypothetical protein [Geomonas agri]